MLNILRYFPKEIAEQIMEYDLSNLEEIRIRTNCPIILKFSIEEKIIQYNPNQEELLKILQLLCDNSIYSYQNQICNRIHYSRRRT
ncbi:MAG: hypothetical protein HFJ52_06690 [Clostridia bacterium]|nr:hypothetical protein [Clostridia bacterium]